MDLDLAHKRYQFFKSERLKGRSGLDIAKELGVSSNAVYKYDRRLHAEIGDEAYSELMSPQQIACRKVAARDGSLRLAKNYDNAPAIKLRTELAESKRALSLLESQIRQQSRTVFPPVDTFSTLEKGYVAELYVRYYLARHGFQVCLPQFTEPAHDLTVLGKSGTYYRCEVKATYSGNMVAVLRSSYVAGRKVPYMEDSRVDFFILVDMPLENVFVLPSSAVYGKGTVCLSQDGMAWPYRDKIDQFA